MVEMDSAIGIGRQAGDKVAKSASRPLEVVLEVPRFSVLSVEPLL